ncbi:hypothetical protein QO034_06430 [Sedimentitalea sp. JM2-8]|uniref:Uncharacterized protein n=1 Tax=Sedimentitalea xiamensis TaxID=3050037 RepID=A0ABT7FCR0_9RHOB|nr:hypothetical protein [Sedimentitalea xiamensis]MDK3072740.1 hypothetical protein [Sedimentitalea xiamensis]
MNEEMFLANLQRVVDAHVNRLAYSHSLLMHGTAVLMRLARQAGVPEEQVLEAVDAESARVDREMDQVVEALTQRLYGPTMH